MDERSVGDGHYRIGAVARMVGVSTHALRAWERRYDALSPKRTEAGGRLYSIDDIERLRLMKSLLAYGHSISNIARLGVQDLTGLLNEHRSSGATDDRPETLVRRYLKAIDALDMDGAEQILLRATALLPPFEVVKQVIVPVLERVGAAWEVGDMCIAQEHAATALVRGHLGGLMRTLQPADTRTTSIATTPAGELHELGALIAAVLATMRGQRVVYLGPNLPASEIVDAVRRTGAQRLLLSVVSLEPGAAEKELCAIAQGLTTRTTALVGGRGVDAVKLPAGFLHLADLDALDAHLTEN